MIRLTTQRLVIRDPLPGDFRDWHRLLKEAEYKSFIWHDGRMKDRVEYRMLRDEWKS